MGNIFSVSCPCDAIVTRCWDFIVGKESYVRKLEENLQHLSISLEELTSLKKDVERRVEVAEQQQHFKRLNQVQTWILRVETAEAHVNQVIKDGALEIEKLCCWGYCSKSYRSSYQLGKKVVKKFEELSDLKSKGLFPEVVSQSIPTTSVKERLIDPTVGMETTIQKVWSHIEDEDVGVIGLYGMGGVGKTTLLTRINNNFRLSPSSFNFVIWIVVSKDIKLDLIQDKIAKEVGIIDDEWKDKAQDEKAGEIFRFLSRKKFVLLLDDVWDRVDLTKVGVPVSNHGNNSKIVFTTRSEDVCGRMGAHKTIRVECLLECEALNLFRERVGRETLSMHPDIPRLAEDVAKECGRLPLALITVGRAMVCKKTPQEWNHAIQVLRKSAAKFSGMEDQVFALLKFSYDNLPNKKVKACFLYCALFPEDFVIYRDRLLYLWMFENLLGKYDHVEEARNETHYIIGILLSACLLEDDGRGTGGMKMHDVIRDMALWLACDVEKSNESFLVQAGAGLTRPPALREWENSKKVSFVANRIENLDETPKSPNLLTLLLSDNKLRMMAPDFFDFMPSLRVLDLSENKDLTELPCGISNLISLQHLDLSKTSIRVLPAEIKALAKLLYLNLENTDMLNYVPQNAISSLQRLRVLKLFGCAASDKILFTDKREVQGFIHLEELTLTMTTFWFSQLCTRSSLHLRSVITSLQILDSTSWVDHMDPWDLGNVKWSELPWDPYCFLGLKSVMISGGCSFRCLTWLIFQARNLSSLSVTNCRGIRNILDGGKLIEMGCVLEEWKPFSKLTSLSLEFLPDLESIYSDVPVNFPDFEIYIVRCPALKKMPFNITCTQYCRYIRIEGEQKWWDGLKWEDELAREAFLPFFIPLPSLPAPQGLLYIM